MSKVVISRLKAERKNRRINKEIKRLQQEIVRGDLVLDLYKERQCCTWGVVKHDPVHLVERQVVMLNAIDDLTAQLVRVY